MGFAAFHGTVDKTIRDPPAGEKEPIVDAESNWIPVGRLCVAA
jgi:hypothetical protein